MAANKKPKPNKGDRSNRSNGKAPKKKPKQNPQATGKTIAGYSPAAVARREQIRSLSFAGLKPS